MISSPSIRKCQPNEKARVCFRNDSLPAQRGAGYNPWGSEHRLVHWDSDHDCVLPPSLLIIISGVISHGKGACVLYILHLCFIRSSLDFTFPMYINLKNGQVTWNRSKIVTEIRSHQKLLHFSPGNWYRITTYDSFRAWGSCPITRVLSNGFSTISLRTVHLNPILSVRTFFLPTFYQDSLFP